jgi:AcrR family transcriptional regulator
MGKRVEAIPAGRHGLSPEEVRANRRARLTAAMVEAVALYGYPGTTIGRLVALARISKSDFYGAFDSKEACFWAAFEDCLRRFSATLATKVGAAKEGRPQIAAAITALADTIDSEPDAVALVLVDSLALGPAAEDPRAGSQERFEAMLRSGVKAAGGADMGTSRARGVVIGMRRLAYRAIRDSDSAQLRRGTPVLVDWIVDCVEAPPPPRADAVRPLIGSPDEITWDSPPADWSSRVRLSPRERIMRACVQLMVEDGYEKLSIPRIVARTGTSNQTLYDEFGSKEGAVLAAFDAAIEPTLLAAGAASAAAGDDPEARIAATIEELRHRLADEPLLGELCFRAMPRVGRPGLERLDVVMGRIAEHLLEAWPGRRSTRRELRAQAAAGGLWGMMRTEALADGGSRAVPTRDLVDFASIAVLGPRAA